MIYDHISADRLLGCLIKDTSLANSEKYSLCKEDFQTQFHKLIYATLHYLAKNGVKNAKFVDIDSIIKPWEAQYNIFLDNDGEKYIDTVQRLVVDSSNFEHYYNNVRKLSCLREYKNNKFDISEFWDMDKKDEDNIANIDKYSINDIIKSFDVTQSKINKKFNNKLKYTEMICGDGFDELLDELEEAPLVGAGLCSGMINELYRGWCKGQLILRGAPSSFGKTLFGMADSINVSSIKLWSDEEGKFIDNPYYQGTGTYIHTEQNSRKDIQTRACSILAKIPYGTLRNGEYNKEEKERLSEAGRILKESNFKLMYYPDFTMSGMREIVKSLSLEGYEYITKDYIWNNSWIISDIKETMGISNTSEPNALMQYANSLKGIAEDCDVAMATMMQLNGKEKDADLVDEGCLYASRAVKTKLDNGSIMKTPTQKEIQATLPFIQQWNKRHNATNFGSGVMIYPNAVSHCFKTRYGGHGENVKIFHLVDKSIGLMEDMFATNWDNTPLVDPRTQRSYELPRLYIERK